MSNTNSQKEQSAIQYSIYSIKLTKSKFSLPNNFKPSNDSKLTFWFESEVLFIEESSIIQVTSIYHFFSNKEIIFEMEVTNDYKIQVFSTAVINGRITDDNFLLFLTELSLGHLRGIQAIEIKDTAIDKFYIPFIGRDRMKEKIRIKNAEIEK